MTPDDPRHGTRAGYYAHRRDKEQACEPCKRAAAAAEADRQLHLLRGIPLTQPSHRVSRRIQALVAIGYTHPELATRLGCTTGNIQQFERGNRAHAREVTIERVCALYDELHMRPAPDSYGARRSRARAKHHGFAPPLAWENIDNPHEQPTSWEYTPRNIRNIYANEGVDPVVVMRLLEGVRIEANRAEKEAAMTQWVADGGTRNELARWHGWKQGRYSAHLRAVDGGAA